MAQTVQLCCSLAHCHVRNAANGHVDAALMEHRPGPVTSDLATPRFLRQAFTQWAIGLQTVFFLISVTRFGASAAEVVRTGKKTVLTLRSEFR